VLSTYEADGTMHTTRSDPTLDDPTLDLSGHSLLRLGGDIQERLQIIETERGAVAPGTGPILERAGKGRCEERSLLPDVRPDRGLDVPTSQCGRWSFG
jgi:hypothetical protein